MRNWQRVVFVLTASVTAFVMISDVQAWPFRRRVRYGRNYTYPTRYYGTTTTTMPSATVTAPGTAVTTPGVGVTTSDYGVAPAAGISAPGIGVGPGGATVGAPGVGVNAGARTATGNIRGGANLSPGQGAQGDLRIRGQSPDGDAAPPPPPQGGNLPQEGLPPAP
jgi:hypothetical protein